MTSSHHAPPAFAADAMLGRLARWLRALGFDTVYQPGIDDHDLVAIADNEDRILLTRDRHLITYLRPHRGLLLSSSKPLEQLGEVSDEYDIEPTADLFNRCLICNSRLRSATPHEIDTRVPQRSRSMPGPFLACPGCGRIYWPGSHVKRMQRALADLFPELRGQTPEG
ncbi:Mut7-C RNAse domain-containing protein [Marinobacter zhanjiangensis]|uniref:Mut7-C RNAse domain-containing protein n=1 Tax=Marinobacter zhanjiangensis TaxID=578215 RepID=A0ABQ3ART5_9GAMM|nr:Mut7-C RNAse domain-containing protein [Marinobacter zhanjiangensis]GGY65796.1 hypothetical protein GCM10007071_10710 [Marinobacter zhanjiangensis]